MGIRVHELAKELKISTGALRVHLKDLGVIVKSHMSQLDDDVVEKIRGMFKQEVEILKKIESDRRKYHESKKQAKRAEREAEQAEKAQKEAERIEKIKIKKEAPVFVEKPIGKQKSAEEPKEEVKKQEKKETSTEQIPEPKTEVAGTAHAKEEKTKTERPKPVIPATPEPPVPPVPPVSGAAKDKKSIPIKKKPGKDELEEKPKHIQAKLKHVKKGKKKTKFVPTEIEEAEISRSIKQTMSKQKKKKYRREDKDDDQSAADQHKIVIDEFTSVNELSKIMDVPPTDIITKFFKMGKIATINQRLDKESLEMICDEFDFDVAFAEEYGSDMIVQASEKHKDAEEYPRPAIVTIMGHVDHGKTSILDYIRKTNVIAGEAGGITQHIGAYQVEYKGSKITFLDTPGHEAFTAMRARGAHITDIAVIVVAADDGVKPQTIEAIDHAKASGVEIIVAINKIDIKTANLDKVISGLSKQNVFLENYGGSVLWTTCSAITGEGIDTLLENIILASEMKELKAKHDVPGSGIVVESEKDSRIGSLVTILLQEGSLKKGDSIVCGATYGKIRKMENERGQEIKKVNPSDVALIYGLNSVPKAGDILNKVDNEKTARQISLERQQKRHERQRFIGRTNLDNLFTKIKEKEMTDLKLIVKADVDGSLEAFCDSLQKLSNEEVMVNIIHKGVGSVLEADVNLAAASDAIIIGFQVRIETRAKKLAEDLDVQIKSYQIIYDGINDIKDAIAGLIEPEYEDVFVGSAVVKQIFKIKGVGVIAGCAVEKGFIRKEGIARLYRNTGMVHEGKLSSLKHFAEDVQEVRAGTECGIGLQNFNDVKEGDVIEIYVPKEIVRKPQ